MKRFLLLFLVLITVRGYTQEKFAVYFNTGADTLNGTYAADLQNWMDWHKSVNVVKVHGYADGVGKTDANSGLSMRRTNTVVELLKANGVTIDEKAEIKGLGEIGKDKDDAQSRKVIIYFEKVKPVVDQLAKQLTKAKKGKRIVLSQLKFIRNSARAMPGSLSFLNNLLRIMQENPALKIDIQGHICCNSDDPKKLGILRAKTVYNHLVDGGIDKSRVSYQSFGSTRPIYPIPENNQVEAEANRRVEIEIIEN